MTSSAKTARARRAKQAQQQQRAAAEADASSGHASSLEDSLRALNAKLIARLRASEAVASDAVAARTVAHKALQTAQRGRKSIDGSLEQLTAEKDALALERDQWKTNCQQLQGAVDELTQRVSNVGDELQRVRNECDRLKNVEVAVGARCATLEKQLVEGKEKLEAERIVISSLERQLEEHVTADEKRGANMSPQSYSSIDTGDTLRSDTCVSGGGIHAPIRVHHECDSAAADEHATMLVETTKSATTTRAHPIVKFFEGIWMWGADLVAKLLSWLGGARGREREAVPLLGV
ncbi:unnamed protein product [Agarophyton chilense]